MESSPPTNKVQLQRLLGKINFLRRSIANLAGKIQPLTPLLRLKDKEEFEWGPPHHEAFYSIKAYLASLPVLMPPQRGKSLKPYIFASKRLIESLLAQNNEGGEEQAIYYLSRSFTEADKIYLSGETMFSFITNNWAKYGVLIIGLEILMELGTHYYGWLLLGDQAIIEILGDEISVSYIPKQSNTIANKMAQLATRVQIQERRFEIEVKVQKKNLLSIFDRRFSLDVMTEEPKIEDWRSIIIQYLEDPFFPTSKNNRQQAAKYVLWEKNLLRKTPDGLLLKCLGQDESMIVMGEVHEGIYGAHQAETKMRWLLRRYGYFWPEMEKDCKAYA
ncbi:uncharacterized protein [Pyrus communis]|uniref:uncharacterized protein n=1 Tax=Pyrus communis TaxID=23211 RepID=UPI0035C1C62F